ncbi:MAG TPA: DUF2157 domain-containing protein [Cyclobacteriaceae bacterium]|jgi:hypothetical protein|nr:DUF2157 domain-containing protein [Cyclobacteriaceae bacterium]
MIRHTPQELLEKGLITQEQFQKIEPIVSGKIVSVFYELRTLLYLGVMLFTTGAGILVYQNIGSIGHVVSIIALTILMLVCFWYVHKLEVGYSNEAVQAPTPYYDYVLLLGCLLFVSIQGYLQFQYGFLDDNLGWSTLITSVLFFYFAYRFDHVGILSLAITALASFWSISVSPQKWYSGDFFSGSNLYNTAIIFSILVGGIAFFLDYKEIKKHFTFTYLNFCMLIFFVGATTGMFNEYWFAYALLIYGGCAFAYYMARHKKSFLFLLYAFLSGYIATTYLLTKTVFEQEPELWLFYSLASCGGFVYFIIKYKTFFKKA